MGKKSREKRARRQHKAIKDALSNRSTLAIKQADDEFARQRAVLEAWLSEFNAEDACVSLCVSELWLPNISSQVKHTFAMGLLASIAPIRFNEAHRIETYPEFRDFVAQLNSRLPSFTMLEDYVPEADWGEVRIELGSSPLHSFYGGAVERISDFVTAFLMLHGETAAAHRDMLAALTIQDHVISNIDRSLVGSVTEIMPGHLEVPAELFWAACRKVLLSISDLPEALQVDVALVTTLGQFLPPRNRSEFGDAVMTGSALPTFLLEVGARRLPISLRDAPAAVIQLWAERSKDPNALVQTASATIGGFLGERFDRGRIVGGPLQLMTRTERLPYTFAAAMTGERQLYLVIAISEEDVQRLPAIEKAVKALLLSDDWGLRPEGAAHGLQLRRVDGTLPSPAEVELIVVPARLSTVPGILNLPKTSARVIPLSDFVTIFDSIEDLAELDRFWAFDEENSAVKGPYGLVDRFAAFRDSHALLADGAITPNLIALDPLWGSKWRYRQLEKSWANSPPLFPYGKSASWKTTREADGLFRLVGRAEEVLSWCAVVDHCVVHVLFQLKHDLKIDDGRMLELMVHCLADSLLQRNVTVAELPLFRHRRIVTICYVHRDIRTTLDDDDAEIDERPLFSDWSGSATPEGDVCART